MTREDILALNVLEPNCFETDREEQWYEVGLKEGLDIAEKNMIAKACEWFSKTLYIHTEETEDKHWNETKTFDWVTSDYDSLSDFIDGFRKAMEE